MTIKQLYNEIPESQLLDNYKKMNIRLPIVGMIPPSSVPLYTIDDIDPNRYDFTDSFVQYMTYNKNLLPYRIDFVTQPNFLIFYMDKNMIVQKKSSNVRTRKMRLTATLQYIQICNMNSMSILYNNLLSDISQLYIMQGVNNTLYFYQLIGVMNASTEIFSFMMRFSLDIKSIRI